MSSDPFFTKKRKRPTTQARQDRRLTSRGPQRAKRAPKEDEIESDSSSNGNEAFFVEDDERDSDEDAALIHETPAEKRLRLAKSYLGQVEQEIGEEAGFDAAEIDRELISARLEQDNLATKEKVYLIIAESCTTARLEVTRTWTRQKACITSLTHGQSDTGERCLYASFKNGDIQKWRCSAEGRGPSILQLRKTVRRAHAASVHCCSASADGQYLATGCSDGTVGLWSTNSLKQLKSFPQHRDSVNSVVFPTIGTEFFSASSDRTVKLFNAKEQAYIETLFGHQDIITCISVLNPNAAVTVGARDRSARLWKIVDETQLVFRGGDRKERFGEGSMDVVTQIDKELFVTGSDNGTVALWSTQKKKALSRIPMAHGNILPISNSAELEPIGDTPENVRWITAVHAIPFSDLVVSGSWDGKLNFYQISADLRKLLKIAEVKIGRGIVNCITSTGDEKQGWRLYVAVGYETRLARWKTVGGAKNEIIEVMIPGKYNEAFSRSIGLGDEFSDDKKLEALEAQVEDKKASVLQKDQELKDLEHRLWVAEQKLKEKEDLAAAKEHSAL
ncbi:WD40-repeat-containing domain protein [Protomyces lactucae-debilis]|uniref:WD40-repeat-containing domain protein n=1 Tax=Protomyces lactucae-debilis TaxID=2754530 RepID=A0A1Y2FS83_PROLT|nr:WD40-repeat-containing domain protein [Protomyces lactucae-debilis]ORY86861.1 WD40-repeat-containing domain protein [Protomyces lactucae-debilis]